MFKNYLITTFRNFKNNRTYSVVNITGLALGLTCAILISLWVLDELSYDRYNKNGENIYRFLIVSAQDENQRGEIFPFAFKDLLLSNDSTLQIMNFQKQEANKIQYEDKIFSNEDIYFADSEVMKFFDLQMLNNVRKETFDNPYSIILSESSALKLFGKKIVVGKTLLINNNIQCTVKGVFKDLPKQVHHRLTIVVSFNTLKKLYPRMFKEFTSSGASIYVYAKTKNDLKYVKKSFRAGFDIIHKDDNFPPIKIEMQPLFDIHLYSSDLKWANSDKGNILYVVGLSIAAILILILACFNYINLSIAKNFMRYREVAVRKVFGANKQQIILQFIFESLFYAVISIIVSLIAVKLLLPSFENFTGKNLSLSLISPFSFGISIIFLLIIILTSIYPAVKMSGCHPAEIIKNNLFTAKGKVGFGLRQILISFQFIITIFLLSSLYIINNQMQMVVNSDLGFNKENTVVISNPHNSEMNDRYKNFKNSISSYPNILSVGSGTNVPPANINNYTYVRLPDWDADKRKHMGLVAVDEGYFRTLKSKILLGRNFRKDSELDKNNSVIINEEAVKELGLSTPIGKQIEGINNTNGKRQTIIGVVKDLYFKSMYAKVEPLVFYNKDWSSNTIIVKISSNNILETMQMLKTKWKEVSDSLTFTYHFMDDSFNKLYKRESVMLDILRIFVLVAIIISSLGLLGMVAFTTARRTKEIGIRKVLGASTLKILSLLTKEFLILFVIANVFAIPIVFYFMNKWLRNFAYKIDIGIIPFVITGFTVLIIALLTISIQTIRAALANPVDSLRSE